MDVARSLLPLAATGLGLSGLCAIPGIVAIASQIRSRKPKDHFYEDIDGTSSPEAVASFSNKVPKGVILLLSLTGLGTALAVSILAALADETDGFVLESWLLSGTWCAVVLQAVVIAAHRDSVQVFELGGWAFVSCVFAGTNGVIQTVHSLRHSNGPQSASNILRITNCAVVGILALSCLLLPRRPDVFFRGRRVDRKFTVPALARITWHWANPLLDIATKKGDLDQEDLPEADHETRSEWLVATWKKFNFDGKLLRSLLWAYKGKIAYQYGLVLIRCVLGVAPLWVMYRLIHGLELRDQGLATNNDLWPLIIVLAVLKMSEQWIDNWVMWVAVSKLSVPLRTQLGALVFGKSIRRKNVKVANREAAQSATDTDNSDGKKDETKPEENDEQSVLKSRQAIVNLVGVDARRISSFGAMSFLIFSSIGKFLLYTTFLIKLIGWIPFGVGMFAWALTLPLNSWATKLYYNSSERLMKTRDEKLAVVNEALLGIRQIKFAALEKQWEKRILAMREKEIAQIIKVFIGDTLLFSCWIISPLLLSVTSLSTYAKIHGGLDPATAFTSIGVFKALEVCLGALPELITMGTDALVSVGRIDVYLRGPEIKNIRTIGLDVSFDDASIAWPVDDEAPDEDRFILRNLNLTFPSGKLSVIAGKTGAGKSLLLSALLGEADLLEGRITMPSTPSSSERHDAKAHAGNWILPGSVAFVGQTPWLESTSLRDNILFGLPYDGKRFNQVLDVCALRRDLETLPDGEKTQLGSNGINLSGGQKWRLTLARAIYSRAEILVMDDIFSAVDAHVGREIYEKCLVGELCHGRTRILVTHHVTLVQPKTTFLVELGEGTVIHSGLVSELDEDGTLQKIKSHEIPQVEVEPELAGGDAITAVNSDEENSVTERQTTNGEQSVVPASSSAEAKQFVQEEIREKGKVKTHIYAVYLSASGGWLFWGICCFIYIAYETSNLGRAYWLRIWTGSQEESVSATIASDHHFAYGLSMHDPLHAASRTMTNAKNNDLMFYLRIYILLAVLSALIGCMRFLWNFVISLKASRALFSTILFSVLRTPLRWLDTVPVGRILNRLTSDFDIIDNKLSLDFGMMFWNVFALLGVCAAAIFVSAWILPLPAALLVVGTFIGRRYLNGTRPVKRLESNNKSPVFDLFNSSLAGVSTVRAFEKGQVYVQRMYDLLDTWGSTNTHMWLFNTWMALRMALVGTIFTTVIGIVLIVAPTVNAAMAGFVMSFALDFSSDILYAIRHYAQLEMDMNAAERVIEYSELKTEALDGEEPPAAWPTSGAMEVDDLVVAYADDLAPVLKGLTFKINNNERIGVVGRTGAGKSSLTLALFRFLESRSGKIYIDGLDISKLKLEALRSRLAIIPQDPVLFSGTVRTNLDPFNDHTDEELRDCLSRVHLVESQLPTPANEPSSAAGSTLAPKNANVFKDLSSGIAESGGNLSQGQRQLLCLARAIVSRPKIMVLDEATSAVDMVTDALIQRSIREEFTDSTLIVIAHRLSTIIDFDRILVLSDGKVAEFGTPKELWEKEGGLFRDMCEHSGETEKLKKTIYGA